MRTRIISGVVASAVVCLILFTGSRELFDVVCALLAAVSVYEVFGAFKSKGFRPVYFAGVCACACILLGSIEYWDRRIWNWLRNVVLFVDIRLMLYFALIAMFCFLIFGTGRYSVADLAVTILGSFYVCFLFWYLIMVRNLSHGDFAVWFVILGAVVTDTAAYFTGTLFGKHRLSPAISPKKTVEGAVGGGLACVAAYAAFGYFVFDRFAYHNPLWQYVLMGAVCGIVAQIGDLAASSIKRYCGIKDFGSLIPGHGGILDRLDSAIVLSPLVYFILQIMVKV